MHSYDENALVAKLMQEADLTEIWIGLTDTHEEGNWSWSDQTPVDYDNWVPGQPNNAYGGVQDCGVFYILDGGWHDDRCSKLHEYLCRRDAP